MSCGGRQRGRRACRNTATSAISSIQTTAGSKYLSCHSLVVDPIRDERSRAIPRSAPPRRAPWVRRRVGRVRLLPAPRRPARRTPRAVPLRTCACRTDERLEVLQAISSGAYRLQPVSLAEGELTPYEEAMARAAAGGAATTPTVPGSSEQRRRLPVRAVASSDAMQRWATMASSKGQAVAMLLQPAVVLARLHTTWT